MSYQVLARKYRPKSFNALVGQETTTRILEHALKTGRLHQAYLFSGTRGVGKTTVARILAKCLNCEKGPSETPCQQCPVCIAIDNGTCPDLIEVDAASKTKVEDTRHLLDNVQYQPTSARFKIYLIDEVHMLSSHSFNALLKTLEEPPEHVKFLLATTDPQKLPVTVLSRCLQFPLKPIAVEAMTQQLASLLKTETIAFEIEALKTISKAANGSLRDALSILEQAINYGEGKVFLKPVNQMLGLSQPEHVLALLEAVIAGDTYSVCTQVKAFDAAGVDFEHLLNQLLEAIHQITLLQVTQESLDLLALSKLVTPEGVQLLYQIGLQGKQDMPFAPNIKMGFEMTLLRMSAFQPMMITLDMTEPKKQEKTAQEAIISPLSSKKENNPDWATLIPQLKLQGLAKIFAEHCALVEWQNNTLKLALESAQKPLLTPRHQERLQAALQTHLGKPIKVEVELTQAYVAKTPVAKAKAAQKEKLDAAKDTLGNDNTLQKFMKTFDAKVDKITLPSSETEQ